MKKIKETTQKMRTLIANGKTEQAIKLGASLSAYIAETDFPIQKYMALFSNRYNQIKKEDLLGTDPHIKEQFNKLSFDILNCLDDIENMEGTDVDTFSHVNSQKYLIMGIALLIGIVALFFVYKMMEKPPIEHKTALILVDTPTIELGTLKFNETKKFTFKLENKGDIAASINPILLSCPFVKILNNTEKVVQPHSVLVYSGEWKAGEGAKFCSFVISGSNLTQSVSMTVFAELEQQAKIKDNLNPTPNKQEGQATGKSGNNAKGVIDPTPQKEKPKIVDKPKEKEPVELPKEKDCFKVVECFTNSIRGISIEFSFEGQDFTGVSTDRPNVKFKVPCAMIGKSVQVHYKRNGIQDHDDATLSVEAPFVAPSSMRSN